MARRKHRHDPLLTRQELIDQYDFTDKLIEGFLPEPVLARDPRTGGRRMMHAWRESDVEMSIHCSPALKEELKKRRRKRERREQLLQQRAAMVRTALTEFSIDTMLEDAKLLERRFTVHCGPTNSGKTYQSILALKQARKGVYLGPLRLLALEVFDTLNVDGVPCCLRTGEEYIEVPFAGITASTVEMLNERERYDVAVIDEAQMLGDPDRGGNWTRALLQVNAAEVHVCTAPEGMPALLKLLQAIEADYEVVTHERLAPLLYDGKLDSLQQVQPGDALIVFSRKDVLATAAELEEVRHLKASVIYGALPPASRREEVRRFNSGETQAVVATDAIGMGISLPIHRVIFAQTKKFDGTDVRPLNSTEIKQIAGRAGRYGKFEEGRVLTMSREELVRSALQAAAGEITSIRIPFPEQALGYDIPLRELLTTWQQLPAPDGFMRVDVTEELQRFDLLWDSPLLSVGKIPTAQLYSWITCPAEVRSKAITDYWVQCCAAIARGEPLPPVEYSENTLEECETKYKMFDVRHQMLRRINVEESTTEDRARLTDRINELLKKSKHGYRSRCQICGAEMPAGSRYRICLKCAQRRR